MWIATRVILVLLGAVALLTGNGAWLASGLVLGLLSVFIYAATIGGNQLRENK